MKSSTSIAGVIIASKCREVFRSARSIHEYRIPQPAEMEVASLTPSHPLAKAQREQANSEPRILTQRQRLTGILQHPEARLCQPLHRERLPRRGSWRKQLLGKLLFLRVSPARISNFQVPSHVPITASPTRWHQLPFSRLYRTVDGSCSPLN